MSSLKGNDFWRSLEELEDTPAFREMLRERFPHFVALANGPASRRGFLKLMGASLAFGGLVGCRRPQERIVPHASRPDGRDPGAAVQYATSMELGGAALGLLVTSLDGRPVKVEGNPGHPASGGGTHAVAQASVLELYDPDRSQAVIRNERGHRMVQDWATFDAFARTHFEGLKATGGQSLAVLAEASSSPSRKALQHRMGEQFPRARWVEYESLSRDTERAGLRTALGVPARAVLDLARAQVVVSLDADLFGDHPDQVRHARDFASGRSGGDGTLSRLYAVESAFSLTGAMADQRLPARSSGIGALALGLAARLVRADAGHGRLAPVLATQLAGIDVTDGADPLLDRMADDLLGNVHGGLVVAGPRQPSAVHALCALINLALGNDGHTVRYVVDPDGERGAHGEALAGLAGAIGGGEVTTLVVLGGNPVYDAPADLGFAAQLETVETSIHLGLYENETAQRCGWHLPRAHYLESWGDARGWSGARGVIQPLIAPLYDGRSDLELLATLLGTPSSGQEIVRETLRADFAEGEFETHWRRTLHDGVVPHGGEFPPVDAAAAGTIALDLSALATAGSGGTELVVVPDGKVHDGRFANLGWLQELPGAMTKITWDNAALVPPADAEVLGVTTNDRISLTAAGATVELPVYVMPGQAPGTIAVAPGYGRGAAGKVGDGVGADVGPLRTTAAMDVIPGCAVAAAAGTHDLACTQDHYPIDPIGESGMERRLDELYRSGDIGHFRDHPDFAQHVVHHPPLEQGFEAHEYDGHRWGMSVDLSKCMGCGTCVVACQAENNVPVVGRQEVENGREMHWIRVDRYFRGDPDAPRAVMMPVTCQQCENAPCEQVCPVAATVHDHEGLNVMVYNRCVGTRYCANNCPYKVRRFNFYKFQDPQSDVEKMAFNPDVTVRSRGVMEKCSFCVQRINRVKIEAGNAGRLIEDGEIVPACGQACPAGAVVFGDLNDPESAIARLHAEGRSYALLGEMNNRPRLRYLAALTNSGDDGEPDGGGHHG